MIDGYPEEHELKAIKEWNKQDFLGLFEYIKDLWYYPTYVRREGREIEMHTGGWSGNEEIIETLQHTFFWYFCWKRIDRGGHYYFELPKTTKSENPLEANNAQIEEKA